MLIYGALFFGVVIAVRYLHKNGTRYKWPWQR